MRTLSVGIGLYLMGTPFLWALDVPALGFLAYGLGCGLVGGIAS